MATMMVPPSAALTEVADAFPPVIPYVSNLVAAQTIDPSTNFTLNFTPWTGANSNDYVQLTILTSSNTVAYATPALYSLSPRALLATNSSIIITNGTLTNSQTYTATLTFGRTFDE